jgi:hypothetical protein
MRIQLEVLASHESYFGAVKHRISSRLGSVLGAKVNLWELRQRKEQLDQLS